MFRECRLDNGLTLLTEEMPDLRSVAIGVWLRRGSRHETPELNGISHFLEHLVFKGTASRTALQIAREIDAIGGQMDAFTAKESTCFYLRVLDRHLDLALDLLTDIVLRPRLAPEDIEKERKVIYEEIRMVEDSPEELLFDLLYEARWKGHALGRPIQGTADSVAAMDPVTLRRFFSESYVPGNMVISAAGRLSGRAMEEKVGAAFAALPVATLSEVKNEPVDHAGILVREKKEMEQLHLTLALDGLPQDHEDRYALMVLSNLLGGTMSSRLFQKVREERGLAYTVYSSVSGYSDAGYHAIYAATHPDSAAEVLQIISGELADLKNGDVSEEELVESRENLKGTIMLSLESTSSRMSSLARKEIAFGRQFSLEEILSAIDAVSGSDLRRLARSTFNAGTATLAALGPLNGFNPRQDDLAF